MLQQEACKAFIGRSKSEKALFFPYTAYLKLLQTCCKKAIIFPGELHDPKYYKDSTLFRWE